MNPTTQSAVLANTSSWASTHEEKPRVQIKINYPISFKKPDQGPYRPPPPSSQGVGHFRDIFDGVTLDRPTEAPSTFLTNTIERISGKRDERQGRALLQVGLAGYQFIQAGIHQASQGTGAIAAGSSVLSKALPTIGIASGAIQVWKGWNELQSHNEGLLSIFGSRTGRTGLLNICAGVLALVPGVGTAFAGAATRLVAAANELDYFNSLDKAASSVESKGNSVARRVHIFDETPTNPYDRTPKKRTQNIVHGISNP